MPRSRVIVLVVLAASLAFSGAALAQVPTDIYKIDYFDNNQAGLTPATVRIANPGSDFTDRCAMIYVFSADQELKECCGCKITPNGLLKLSVQSNLTANPANGVTPEAGVIEIFSTATGTSLAGPPGSSSLCNPGDTTAVPAPALRAWATHIQDSGAITETFFQDAPSLGNLPVLQLECLLIEGAAVNPVTIAGSGSGKGLCDCTNQLTGKIDP